MVELHAKAASLVQQAAAAACSVLAQQGSNLRCQGVLACLHPTLAAAAALLSPSSSPSVEMQASMLQLLPLLLQLLPGMLEDVPADERPDDPGEKQF